MAEEEIKQELTVEEMKNAVSMASVLPALFTTVEEIKRKVEKLSISNANMAESYNKYASEINTFTTKVVEVINQQQKMMTAIETLTKEVQKLNKSASSASISNLLLNAPVNQSESTQTSDKSKKASKKVEGKSQPKSEEQNKEETKETAAQKAQREFNEKGEIQDIAWKVINSAKNKKNKNRLLPKKLLMTEFKLDDKMADKVIDYLVKIKSYNKETNTLTYLNNKKN